MLMRHILGVFLCQFWVDLLGSSKTTGASKGCNRRKRQWWGVYSCGDGASQCGDVLAVLGFLARELKFPPENS